ncbi:hypothetical protein BGZ65_009988 [Modicella reniformis]|uniref:CRIB domain-containing protein n=1 Tax=Modicella reniformis TaxID=1440133 RepID=A0A9P6LRX8_9FUNG|nr:hypothetical protein BGZ65_009988 [Modicella reniformis]
MGALFSKSTKTQKSKDPKWQGIGPNTPISSSTNNYNQQPRSHTTLNNRPNNNATSGNTRSSPSTAKPNKSSKIMVLLKLGPKGHGQRRVISKNLISLPSDFRHTGHIGAGEVRSGQIDPEKIKNQMMEVAACLKLDLNSPMPALKTMPVQPENQEDVYTGPNQVDRYATRPTAEAVAF